MALDMVFEHSPTFGGRSMDKIQKHGWSLKDEPGIYRMIRKGSLKVNDNYQRQTSVARIAAIRAEWSWVACGALTVARRGNDLWVMDGQHRLNAALARSDIVELPCLVFETTDVTEEAAGFLSANVNRKQMATFERWRALLVSGDPLAMKIEAVFIRCGVKPRSSGNLHSSRSLAFLGTCVREAERDFQSFETVIEIVAALCATRSIPEKLFAGLIYLKGKGLDLTNARVLQRLNSVGVNKMLDGAERAAAFYTRGGAKVWAAGILEEINRNLQKKITLEID